MAPYFTVSLLQTTISQPTPSLSSLNYSIACSYCVFQSRLPTRVHSTLKDRSPKICLATEVCGRLIENLILHRFLRSLCITASRDV